MTVMGRILGLERFWRRRDARAVPTALARPGPPPGLGEAARGRALVEAARGGRSILMLAPGPDTEAMHRFGWLDDLAALGGPAARDLAWRWIDEWIGRHEGPGEGWSPNILSARIARWFGHAAWLTQTPPRPERRALFLRSLSRQTRWLARHWSGAAPSERPQVLAALIAAETALDGAPAQSARRAAAMGRAAAEAVGPDGGIGARAPEALLELFCALVESAELLGQHVTSPHRDAITRIAPVLRGLRHVDGGLARFHGGGRGAPGRVERALAQAPRGAAAPLPMGFARLASGRSSVIIDAAAPPEGPGATMAHASTLAFEMTVGRRPLIVNCGSGLRHGPDWRRAGRATPSHSTLCVEGRSSARLDQTPDGRETLRDGPREVLTHRFDAERLQRMEASHDAWRKAFGLTHDRRLALDRGGAVLVGEDLLTTLGPPDERAFEAASRAGRHPGVGFAIRFHLHPDVVAESDPHGTTARLTLRSGEVWELSHDGGARLSLAPSVYLENSHPDPVPTQQVVLSGRAMAYATLVRWSLVRMGDGVPAPRDLWRGEDAPA